MTKKTNNAPVYDALDVCTILDIPFTKKFIDVGPTPEPLDGLLRFFDPGRSILWMRDSVVSRKEAIFSEHPWYESEEFAMRRAAPCYRQLSMSAMDDSFGKTFTEAAGLLDIGFDIPLARVVVTAMLVHYLRTRTRLYSGSWIRCLDTTDDGHLVSVGYFDRDGVRFSDDQADTRDGNLGLVVSRKLP